MQGQEPEHPKIVAAALVAVGLAVATGVIA
jgi:hypothetical protein